MAPPRATTCKLCGAPRYEACEYALCKEHFAEIARERKHGCRVRMVQSHAPDARRLADWLKLAGKLGANEDEAWRMALAVSVAVDAGEYEPGMWTRRFLERELAYLRRTADVRAKLDAWQPVAGMVNTEWQPPAVAWELEETA